MTHPIYIVVRTKQKLMHDGSFKNYRPDMTYNNLYHKVLMNVILCVFGCLFATNLLYQDESNECCSLHTTYL